LGADSNSIGPAVAIAVGVEVLQLHAERQPTSQGALLLTHSVHWSPAAIEPNGCSIVLYILHAGCQVETHFFILENVEIMLNH
jgi:hypothetical protein